MGWVTQIYPTTCLPNFDLRSAPFDKDESDYYGGEIEVADKDPKRSPTCKGKYCQNENQGTELADWLTKFGKRGKSAKASQGKDIETILKLFYIDGLVKTSKFEAPTTVTLGKIDFVHFEGIEATSSKDFDMVIIFKDFKKSVIVFKNLPITIYPFLKKWLKKFPVRYSSSSKVLDWKVLMKNVTSDIATFLENGAWKTLLKDPTSANDDYEGPNDDDEYEDDEYEDEEKEGDNNDVEDDKNK
ncbi:unnamed protein product [Gordionus sp. m RMFG-2023]